MSKRSHTPRKTSSTIGVSIVPEQYAVALMIGEKAHLLKPAQAKSLASALILAANQIMKEVLPNVGRSNQGLEAPGLGTGHVGPVENIGRPSVAGEGDVG